MKSDKVFDPRKIKKEISKELVSYFPELKTYTDVKLYKILGCFIVGFEIELPICDVYDEYTSSMVNFQIKPLCVEPLDISDSIYDLYVPDHLCWGAVQINPKTYKEDCARVAKGFRNKIKFPLEGNVKLESLFEVCNKKLSLSNPDYIFDSKLLAIKLYASIYVNSKYHIDLILNKIKGKKIKVWCKDRNMYISKHFSSFYSNLEYHANNREDFMSIVEMNKSNSKLNRLTRSEITL